MISYCRSWHDGNRGRITSTDCVYLLLECTEIISCTFFSNCLSAVIQVLIVTLNPHTNFICPYVWHSWFLVFLPHSIMKLRSVILLHLCMCLYHTNYFRTTSLIFTKIRENALMMKTILHSFICQYQHGKYASF